MSKGFQFVLAFIIALFTLPFFGNPVLAAEDTQFDDGQYDLHYLILKDNENAESSAARSFVTPAQLTVENGTKTVQIGFKSSKMIEKLGLQNIDFEITRDEEQDTGTITFQVEDLTKPLFLDMVINAGSYGKMEHTVRVFLNVDSVSDIPESQLDSSIVKEEQPEADTENMGILKEDGYYSITFAALHAEKEQPSAMARYMADSAFVSNQAGKVELTIAVADQTVTKLQVNGQDAVASRVDGDTRYDTYALESLPQELVAYVEYQAPYNGSVHHGKADFRIALDETSLVSATEEDKYAAEYVAEQKPNNDKGQQQSDNKADDGKADNEKDSATKEDTKKDTETKAKDQQAPDKAFTINYTVKHATEDKDSAANQFFKKPAILLTKNGVNYLQLTITSSDMVDSLKTVNGDVAILKKNSDGSMVVQFKVDRDLNNPMKLDMHITVPGMYSMDHSARLFLDLTSKTETDATNYKIATAANSNGVTVNPQTGENSNILLYVFLLSGSGLTLAMVARRRFA